MVNFCPRVRFPNEKKLWMYMFVFEKYFLTKVERSYLVVYICAKMSA